MGDEPFLRSHCPGGAGCFCDGAEHVYLRERTVTPPRAVTRSSRSRRISNKGHGVAEVTISKTTAHSATVSSTSTASVELVTSALTGRSGRAGSSQPRQPAPASRRSQRPSSPGRQRSETPSLEYLAYSSDDEYEEFISKPKTDYTYAHSVSYNAISPQRVTPPNMSRRCLHSYSGSAAGSAGTLGKLDERFDLSLTSRETRSYRREVTSHVTASTTSTTTDGKGSLYELSRGLDVDSGDEDWVEVQNNNLSKSSAPQSRWSGRPAAAASSRRTVSSLLLTLLYPFTYLWVAASDAGRRLLWRQRTAAPVAAPAPPPARDTVDYRRWMRGLSQPSAADGRAARPRSRAAGHQSTTTVTSWVTTITSTVVTVLWWPVEAAAAASSSVAAGVSSAGRRSADWVRSVSESADLPRRSTALLHCLSPRTWTQWAGAKLSYLSPAGVVRPARWRLAGSAAGRVPSPLGWLRSAGLAVLSAVQWTATAAAETATGAGRWTAGAVGGAAEGAAGAVTGVARSTSAAVVGTAEDVSGAVAAASRRTLSSVWPGAGAAVSGGLTESGARRRRLCLCLLPVLLLLLLLCAPLLWGLYCEDDPAVAAAARQESAVLRQLKAAPVTAWTAFRDTAAFVGTSTVDTLGSVYGYLSLLGGSAVLSPVAPVPPPPAAAPAPAPPLAAAPVVPLVSSVSLEEVNVRLEELHGRLAALQTDFQSCRTAAEAAARPAAVRAALGLGSAALLTADQLAASERRQTEQLSAQLAAERRRLEQRDSRTEAEQAERRHRLEARLTQLETAAGQVALLQTDAGRTERRTDDLTGQLAQLQQEFSDLHRTLLVVQEGLKQMRSCCNRTDPDWSALLSQQLQSLESELDGRLRVYAADIKQDLVSESTSAAAAAAAAAGSARGVSREEVVSIARNTVALYDADKTGKFDYALESAGGSVVSTKCTESYNVKSARISVLGIPLWYPSNNPRTIIQPSVSPGECYAFRGQGYFVIALSRRIRPTDFVMEHISRNLTPTAAIDSAPRNFTVLGLQSASDQEGVVLGRYVYQESGLPLQEFVVRPPVDAAFSVVELRVHDNWGHRDYTCLYRFRVHGQPDPADSPAAAPAVGGEERRDGR